MFAGGCAAGAGLSGTVVFTITAYVTLTAMWVATMTAYWTSTPPVSRPVCIGIERREGREIGVAPVAQENPRGLQVHHRRHGPECASIRAPC